MVGVDTNVLLRFLVQDGSEQSRQATQFLSSQETFFITTIVLAEIVWALKRCYQWERREIFILLETLLEATNLVFEDEDAVSHATLAFRNGGDWADHLIQAKCKKHHCTSLATFDRKFANFYSDFVKVL